MAFLNHVSCIQKSFVPHSHADRAAVSVRAVMPLSSYKGWRCRLLIQWERWGKVCPQHERHCAWVQRVDLFTECSPYSPFCGSIPLVPLSVTPSINRRTVVDSLLTHQSGQHRCYGTWCDLEHIYLWNLESSEHPGFSLQESPVQSCWIIAASSFQ